VLVAIANYGAGNRDHAQRLLDAYAAMPFPVRRVVLSNIPKDFGPDVEVLVGLPSQNPWSLPFAHRPLFAQRRDDFDLFIYSEDDTLITESNIRAYLDVTRALPEDEIAGFLRTETAPDGRVFYSTAHSFFHWRPGSVRDRGGTRVAEFTNDHGAAYMLTREQLARAIDSGGFLVEPHEGRYDMLVSAATDPYTRCGMRRVLPIDRLGDFTLPHLTNKYVGRMGLDSARMDRLVEALRQTHAGRRPARELLPTETRLPGARWSRHYYEPADDRLVQAVEPGQAVLSYGAGWGELESALVERGARVTATPLDSAVSILLEDRGIEVTPADHGEALAALAGRSFDVILAPDVVHLAPDPSRRLRDLRGLTADGGRLILRAPNLGSASVLRQRWITRNGMAGAGDYERSGVHPSTRAWLTRTLRQSGWRAQRCGWAYGERAGAWSRRLGGAMAPLLASGLYLEAAPA